MAGMTTTGNTNISDYGSRTVEIAVTGVCRQDIMRLSNYTVKIPYSRMSQTIKNINQMGGKVAKVTLLPNKPSVRVSESVPHKKARKKD